MDCGAKVVERPRRNVRQVVGRIQRPPNGFSAASVVESGDISVFDRYGYSWGGSNGLQTAARRPSSLKAVISAYSTGDYAYDTFLFISKLSVEVSFYDAFLLITMLALKSQPYISFHPDNRFTDDIHYKAGRVLGHGMLSWATVMFLWNARPPHPRFFDGQRENWLEAWKRRLEKGWRSWDAIWMKHNVSQNAKT